MEAVLKKHKESMVSNVGHRPSDPKRVQMEHRSQFHGFQDPSGMRRTSSAPVGFEDCGNSDYDENNGNDDEYAGFYDFVKNEEPVLESRSNSRPENSEWQRSLTESGFGPSLSGSGSFLRTCLTVHSANGKSRLMAVSCGGAPSSSWHDRYRTSHQVLLL
jgi:hypothetical protein